MRRPSDTVKDEDIRGFGYYISEILRAKRITVKQFAAQISTSDYEYDIGEDTLYKILEDVRRPDAYQMVVIIDVAGADDLEAMKRMRAFTRYLARIGKLNEYNITR